MTCIDTLPVTGSWAGALTPPDLDGYTQVVFVALADNSETDGSLQLPFHTIGEGLSEASARTPSYSAPVCVYVFPGVYGEDNLSMISYVHLQGANKDSTIIRHNNKILTIGVNNTSVSGITFEATSTNNIISIDGTSMTDYARLHNCKFIGNGSDNNIVKSENGGVARFYDCDFEAENVGDRILETDTDSGNDFQLYKSTILGDILHAGGDLELSDVTANTGVSCTGSSSLSISDSFLRNSIDHCIQLGTTGNIFLYRNTIVSPGYVDPDNLRCIVATVDPATNEWIDNSFRHDGPSSDYSIFSSVSFTFSGDRNNIEAGYNSNITDDGLSTKGVPVNTDLVIIEDSEDKYKRKRAQLSNLLGDDANAIHTNQAEEISSVDEKESPVDSDIIIIEDSNDSYNKKKVQIGNLPGGGSGASNLSELTIDTDKDWQGFSITNLDEVDITGALTLPWDATPVNEGDIRYNSSEVAIEYYDGSVWHDAGSPAMVYAAENSIAEGNNSLTGLKNKFIVKLLEISTISTDWNFTVYSKDDYTSDPITILKDRNGSLLYYWDFPYYDKDETEEFHYNFTDSLGSNTHNIKLWGTSLR